MNNSQCTYCGRGLGTDSSHRVKALFGPDHCRLCESIFKRKKLRRNKSSEEKQHDSDYKKFLRGELYTDIKVTHTTADGKCVTNKRLKPITDFFKVQD